MQKKKLLLISPSQFGYLTDYYYYCKYLKEEYLITVLCFDEGLKKVSLCDVQIKYVPLAGNRITRYLRWLKYVYLEISQSNYDIVFSYSFKFCFLLKLLSAKKQIVLDVRTGSVKENPLINWFQNWQLRFESYFFDHITIISRGLIKHLNLNPKKCHWLPLGAEKLNNSNCGYNSMKLLYVGTLNHRKLHETVLGFSMFHKKYGVDIACTYNIFGFGSEIEENLLRETINDLNLNAIVKFHGRKNLHEIHDYYRESNIGICYIPITPYFDFQPPTKTFEYILAGMVCIGTATFENSNLLTEENGILCNDSSSSFCNALVKYYHNRNNYTYSSVVNSLANYTWDRIINTNLKPYLNMLISDA
ncbi:glycosyltransferase [Ancylomarina longa]|uniref:Glycosyltransferase n=1 Tax=Ancylomarina longa TaxID=2487017 RepID=A0A434AZ35_9BACT|nr:glycosyltransferase [Ancylomarina longa]RUT79881.1 glycosyltransferase [Ancylomarina longa]